MDEVCRATFDDHGARLDRHDAEIHTIFSLHDTLEKRVSDCVLEVAVLKTKLGIYIAICAFGGSTIGALVVVGFEHWLGARK